MVYITIKTHQNKILKYILYIFQIQIILNNITLISIFYLCFIFLMGKYSLHHSMKCSYEFICLESNNFYNYKLFHLKQHFKLQRHFNIKQNLFKVYLNNNYKLFYFHLQALKFNNHFHKIRLYIHNCFINNLKSHFYRYIVYIMLYYLQYWNPLQYLIYSSHNLFHIKRMNGFLL